MCILSLWLTHRLHVKSLRQRQAYLFVKMLHVIVVSCPHHRAVFFSFGEMLIFSLLFPLPAKTLHLPRQFFGEGEVRGWKIEGMVK